MITWVPTLTILLSFANPTFAGEPVSFDQKLSRQSQDDFKTKHVWRSGERIRAHFLSHCERTLTVDPHLPGGLQSFRHSDRFLIEETSHGDLQKIRDWRGMSYPGVLEVIAPVPSGASDANTQSYRARVVSLLPPELEINPGPKTVAFLKQNTAVVLIGEITELNQKYMWLKTSWFKYPVKFRDGAPFLEGDLSGTITTLDGQERLEVGDIVRLRVHGMGDGRLRAEPRHCCYLEDPSYGRWLRYRRERNIVRELVRSMLVATRWHNWGLVRLVDANLSTHRLTPIEAARRTSLLDKVPEAQRAIKVTTENRAAADEFNAAFDLNLEEMSLAQLHEFAKHWSQMKLGAAPRVAKAARDQTILLEALRRFGAPVDWVVEVATSAARHRLRYFELRSQVGVGIRESDETEMINLADSLRHLGHLITPDSIDFLISTCVQLAYLEHQDWTYAGHFTRVAFQALNRQVNLSREDRTDAGRAARRIFTRRTPELNAAFGDLQTARAAGDRRAHQTQQIFRFALEVIEGWATL